MADSSKEGFASSLLCAVCPCYKATRGEAKSTRVEDEVDSFLYRQALPCHATLRISYVRLAFFLGVCASFLSFIFSFSYRAMRCASRCEMV